MPELTLLELLNTAQLCYYRVLGFGTDLALHSLHHLLYTLQYAPYVWVQKLFYIGCALYFYSSLRLPRLRAAHYCILYALLASLWIGAYCMLFAPNREQDPVFIFFNTLVLGAIVLMYLLEALHILLGLQHWDVGFPIQTVLARTITRLVARLSTFLILCIAYSKTAQACGALLLHPYYVVFAYVWIALAIRRYRTAITWEINSYSQDLFLEAHWLNIAYLTLGFFCLLHIADTGIEDRLLLTATTVGLVALVWAMDWYLTNWIVRFWAKLRDCNYHTNYNIAVTIARILLVVGGCLMGQAIWQVYYIPHGQPYSTIYAFFCKLAAVMLGTEILIVASGLTLQRITLQEHEFNIEKRKQRTSTLFPVIKLGFNIVRIVGCAMLLLGVVGLEPQSIISHISLSLAAVGFVLKDECAGVLSGLILVLEDAINVGDLVEVDQTMGEIEEIGLRSLRIRSIDGTLHYILFAKIHTLRNKSKEYSYVMLNIAVVPETDLERLKLSIKAAYTATKPKVEQENIIIGKIEQRGVVEVTAERMVYQVRIMCSRGKQFVVKRVLNAELHREFQASQIKMPTCQNVVIQNSSISTSEYLVH